MNTLSSILAAALLAAAGMQPALAADDDLSKRIAACTHEQDDARRLACFDRAAAPKASAEKPDATQTFGVKGSELARAQDDGDDEQQSASSKRLWNR